MIVCVRTLGYGHPGTPWPTAVYRTPCGPSPVSEGLVSLSGPLMGRIQQKRRGLGQKVPATEKIVSIFEEHTRPQTYRKRG